MSQLNLLMVHGLLGPINYFEPRKFLPEFQVHTPDMLGYGAQGGATDGMGINLQSQADFVAETIRDRRAKTWLLGHSIGGAVAMLVAQRIPELICGLISVEGNFTLNDAFWCDKIARTELDEWTQQYRVMATDPEGFLARSEIAVNGERLAWAKAILDNQSAVTVHSMARSVIHETGLPSYRELVRTVARKTPIYLLSGERSAKDWDVPDFVREMAVDYIVIPNTGHMMMLEEPAEFCRSVASFINCETE